MNRLPGPAQQPYAPQAGQPTTDDPRIDRIATAFKAALDEADQPPTFYKDPTEVPTIGTAPPIPQPGRPPMSQRAVDLNTTLLSSSVVIGMTGLAGTGILWASGNANPTVIAWICAAIVGVPAALTLPVLALKGLMHSAKQVAEAAPPVIHQHYNGAVHQDQRTSHITSGTTGLIAISKNTPELPR